MSNPLDSCPTCGKRITDVDPMGCETEGGQRYCLPHLTLDADPDLFDAWRKYGATVEVGADVDDPFAMADLSQRSQTDMDKS